MAHIALLRKLNVYGRRTHSCKNDLTKDPYAARQHNDEKEQDISPKIKEGRLYERQRINLHNKNSASYLVESGRRAHYFQQQVLIMISQI